MTVMIDWTTAKLPLASDALINGGCFVSIDALGKVEYRTDRRLLVEGSHDSRIAIRGGLGVLEFSGNPSKFLQGHNLFGPADLVPLMDRCLQVISEKLGLTPSASDLQAWRTGSYDLSRIDVARMIDCGSPERVRKVLDALAWWPRRSIKLARSLAPAASISAKGHAA